MRVVRLLSARPLSALRQGRRCARNYPVALTTEESCDGRRHDDALAPQLNATLGEGTITKVGAAFRGIYQWTVNFDLGSESGEFGEPPLQIKFGPSAWFAIEEDPNWQHTVDPDVADYSRLFLTRSAQREIRQSSVTLQEVLDGLEPTDRRLHDEILQLIRPPATAPEAGAFS